MLIRYGFDIEIAVAQTTSLITQLDIHTSRKHDIVEDRFVCSSDSSGGRLYNDFYGNVCRRFTLQPGVHALHRRGVVSDNGQPDHRDLSVLCKPISALPDDVLIYLMASRYCELDHLAVMAAQNFGHLPQGCAMVQAIVDFAHASLRFNYGLARPTRSAQDALREGTGVCRDFAHVAIALCRAMSIPARYATGYLGDIGVPPDPAPMDFSAWFEAYVGDRWVTFDARHNKPRIGRVVMAYGRDAADTALITSFGAHTLNRFEVVTDEVAASADAA